MRTKSGDKSGKGQKQTVTNIFGAADVMVNVRDIQKKLDKKKSDGSSLTVTEQDKE